MFPDKPVLLSASRCQGPDPAAWRIQIQELFYHRVMPLIETSILRNGIFDLQNTDPSFSPAVSGFE